MRVRRQRYIHLAGVLFRDEAERAEQRIFGDVWVRETGTDSPDAQCQCSYGFEAVRRGMRQKRTEARLRSLP